MSVPNEVTTEIVLPLPVDDKDYMVTIDIRAVRRADISTGKFMQETAAHTIQDTYTKDQLNALLYHLAPVSPT